MESWLRSNKHKIHLLTQNFDGELILKSTAKRAEATSLSDVVRRGSGESSNNSRLSQLRRGKQERFQPSSCPKLLFVQCAFTSHRVPPRLSAALTRGKPRPRLYGGVRPGFFSKNVKNVKDFRCDVKAKGDSVFKVSILNRPSTFAVDTDLTLLYAVG